MTSLYSTNLTFNRFVQVNETVRYRPDPREPHKTMFAQDAKITAKATFKRLSNMIEDWTIERFGQNAKIGREGFEGVLANVSKGVFRDERDHTHS